MSNAVNVSKLGQLAAHIANLVSLSNRNAAIPAGTVLDFAGTTAPTGYLLAAGQEVSRATYPDLDTIIGTTYGAYTNGSGGAGTTHFRLPDLRGRVVAGKDNMGGTAASRLTTGGSGVNGTTLGAAGGTETQALTSAQLPAHNHAVFLNDPGHVHNVNGFANFVASTSSNAAYDDLQPRSGGPISGHILSNTTGITVRSASGGGGTANQTADTGTGAAHNNTQPTLVLNKIIKT